MPLTTLDERTALVVVDLQNGVLARPAAPHAVQDVIARVVELADAFRKHDLPVVLVRFTSGAEPRRTDMSGRGGGPLPDGWDVIVDELAGHPDDIVVTKRVWGSFHGTDLDRRLRELGVTQVVLAGVATSIGVESTARAANEHGYHVTLATDAMTDLSAEAHAHTVGRVFPLLGETGTAADVIALLDKG